MKTISKEYLKSPAMEYRIIGVYNAVLYRYLRDLGLPFTKKHISKTTAFIKNKYRTESFWTNKSMWFNDILAFAPKAFKYRTGPHNYQSEDIKHLLKLALMARVLRYDPIFFNVHKVNLENLWNNHVAIATNYIGSRLSKKDKSPYCKILAEMGGFDLIYCLKKFKSKKSDKVEKLIEAIKNEYKKNGIKGTSYWNVMRRNTKDIQTFKEQFREEYEALQHNN